MAQPSAIRDVYKRRLAGIRTRRNLTQQQLSQAMDEIGFPISRSTIAKIEKGRRPMEVSELVAFAAALDVPPSALFLPLDEATVALADYKTVDFADAAAWAADKRPLDPANLRTYLLESPTFSAEVHLEAHVGIRTAGVVIPAERADG